MTDNTSITAETTNMARLWPTRGISVAIFLCPIARTCLIVSELEILPWIVDDDEMNAESSVAGSLNHSIYYMLEVSHTRGEEDGKEKRNFERVEHRGNQSRLQDERQGPRLPRR